MDWSDNFSMEGSSDVAVLDQQVFGVLWELRSFENADGWGTVRLEWCWARLRVTKPGQVSTVELDLFRRDGVRVVL